MKKLAGLILSIFASIFLSFVITKLWGWFIVGQFGLPQIGVWHAYGLLTLASCFSVSRAMAKLVQDDKDIKEDDGHLIRPLMLILMTPIILLVGYLVSLGL